MNTYKTDIGDTFDPDVYPLVMSELSIISHNMAQLPGENKGEIVISFLKDHCLQVTWIDNSREATGLITSGFLETSNLESLFNACRHNPVFLKSFENVIQQRMTTTVTG